MGPQHSDCPCPMCDAVVKAVVAASVTNARGNNLDRFTDDELCQMHLDAGKRALTHYTNVERLIGCMSRMDINDPDYDRIRQTTRICMEVGNEAHELQQEIAATIRARRANADA